ncbi:MAG: AgmX/PglI C-terminal domain-containing protein [Kofleriaceae bacterium]
MRNEPVPAAAEDPRVIAAKPHGGAIQERGPAESDLAEGTDLEAGVGDEVGEERDGSSPGVGPGGVVDDPGDDPTSAPTAVSMGIPSSHGELDQAIIRRSIKHHVSKIQHCYEKELLTKPSLAGTVHTTFLITPQGKVASSHASGVDASVAACIAAVLKTIEFPKPKNGGSVEVNFPFTFRSANGS